MQWNLYVSFFILSCIGPKFDRLSNYSVDMYNTYLNTYG